MNRSKYYQYLAWAGMVLVHNKEPTEALVFALFTFRERKVWLRFGDLKAFYRILCF
jgi:hypothetical protein